MKTVSDADMIRRLAKMSGMMVNSRFYRALRGIEALNRELNLPYVPPKGNDYEFTLRNGKVVTLFVPEGKSALTTAMNEGFEVYSFCKKSI